MVHIETNWLRLLHTLSKSPKLVSKSGRFKLRNHRNHGKYRNHVKIVQNLGPGGMVAISQVLFIPQRSMTYATVLEFYGERISGIIRTIWMLAKSKNSQQRFLVKLFKIINWKRELYQASSFVMGHRTLTVKGYQDYPLLIQQSQ